MRLKVNFWLRIKKQSIIQPLFSGACRCGTPIFAAQKLEPPLRATPRERVPLKEDNQKPTFNRTREIKPPRAYARGIFIPI